MAISDLQPVDYGAFLNQPQSALPGQVGQAQFQQEQTRQLQLAAVQRQAQQQQALAAARQQAISNPTTQNLSALQILDPEHSDAIKSAHDALTKDQQTQQLREVSAVQGYLGAGRPQDAAAIVQRRIDADKAAGVDTSDDEQMLNLINTNPDQAKGVVANHLFAVLGPDKYSTAMESAGKEARATAEEPGIIAKQGADLASTNATTASTQATAAKTAEETALLKTPRPEIKVLTNDDGSQRVVVVGQGVQGGAPAAAQPLPGPVGQQITAAASAAGANDAEQSYLNATARIESGGNPNTKNGSSTGVFGFHADTFKGAGGSDITNTAQQTTAALNLARQNAQQLGQVLGKPATPQQVYLAHQQGAGGAAALLTADPNTSAIAALQAAGVPPKLAQLSITGNGGSPNMTAGQFVNMVSGKYDKAAGGSASAPPSDGYGVRTLDDGGGSSSVSHEFSPDTVDYLAQQYVLTGQPPPMGQGKLATKNRDAVYERAAEIERETGATGADAVSRHLAIKASGQALAQISKTESAIRASEGTFHDNMGIVRGLLQGAGPTGSPAINAPIQYLRKNVFGSKDVAAFDAALGTVADEYAKITTTATGSGGAATSDAARKEVYDRLSKAGTVGQLLKVMDTLDQEAGNRTANLAKEKDVIQAAIKNGGVAPKQPTTPSAPVKVTSPTEASKLAPGTQFVTPDGQIRVRH